PEAPHADVAQRLTRFLDAHPGAALVHFHGPAAGEARHVLTTAGLAMRHADLTAATDLERELRGVYRDALAHGASVPLQGATAEPVATVAGEAGCLTVTESAAPWLPRAAADGLPFLALALELPGFAERQAAWRMRGATTDAARALAARFRITVSEIAA